MNLYNIISSLDLREDLPKPELYLNVKLISDYTSQNVSSMNKPELINLIIGLKKYIANRNTIDNVNYIFDSTNITLDKEQLKIVHSSPDINMRVIAGAGSGKTTTILCRVKYILDNFTTPDRILILTFNRDSAQNIRNRISSLFGFNIHIQIYTIDAFCCKLLNYYKYDNTTKIYSLSEYSNTGLELMKKYGKEITSQYKYIFFDEFQDVNDTQFSILKIFVDNGCYLTVIGDDCQNIYQFRGTNNYYMINFDKVIKSQTYKLTTNYRSTEQIVNIANQSIKNNELKVEKNMVAINKSIKYIPNTEIEVSKPKLVLCKTELDSLDYICKKIQILIDNGIKLDSIAVLARNSFPLKLIETEFTKRGLEHVACITDKNSDDIKRILVPNKIAVTTIHKSKGLEWDVVFILGFSHEHFPAHLNNNIKNIEEERRLFYVGITRAKYSLYLVSYTKEFPLSIFISEVYDLLSMVRYRIEEKIDKKKLFDFSAINLVIKESYGVNELVTLLDPNDLSKLRENNLIPNIEPKTVNLFDKNTEFSFTNSIKAFAHEPDLGEYCDRYITRGIIINNKTNLQVTCFEDLDTEHIINTKEIDEKDYEMYNLLKSNPNIFKVSKVNNPELKHLIELMEQAEKHSNNIVRKFTYPKNILEKISNVYKKVKDLDNPNSKLLEEIYWVSLCRNFRNDRNRLVYKNIFPLIEQNLFLKFDNITLINRLDGIIKLFGTNQENTKISSKCKINVLHKFSTNISKKCVICGEIDFINLDSKTLVDFKCSEGEFKLEWLIQLLIYYSLYKNKEEIDKISIINVFKGKEYIFDLPKNYDANGLIKFLENKISQDQNSFRPGPSIGLDGIEDTDKDLVTKNTSVINKSHYEINFTLFSDENRPYSMILDTETSDFNGDILQFSWVLIDESNNIISESNYYVKNRIPSKDSYEIHKISIDKLRKLGSDLTSVMLNFVKDLQKCKTIIGHNVGYDLRCILKNMRKYDIIIKNSDKIMYNIFDNFDILCTKKLSGNRSLEKLYFDLFKTNFVDAHDSYVDVINTRKCYIGLLEEINKTINEQKNSNILNK